LHTHTAGVLTEVVARVGLHVDTTAYVFYVLVILRDIWLR